MKMLIRDLTLCSYGVQWTSALNWDKHVDERVYYMPHCMASHKDICPFEQCVQKTRVSVLKNINSGNARETVISPRSGKRKDNI
jgi:hypothetical protein